MINMLDTNTCSYIMRKSSHAVIRHFEKVDPDSIYISSIVLAELKYGAVKHPKYSQAVNDFLTMVNVIHFDSSAADHYAEIRHALQTQGNIIGPNDLLIAAHTRSLDATLITNNIKEFKRVDDLKLENWIL
jgi:tRNA(fMet)-specific endonuclease VapC